MPLKSHIYFFVDDVIFIFPAKISEWRTLHDILFISSWNMVWYQFGKFLFAISLILNLTIMGMSPIANELLWCPYCILGIRPHCTWVWWFVIYIGHNPIHLCIYPMCNCICWAWTLMDKIVFVGRSTGYIIWSILNAYIEVIIFIKCEEEWMHDWFLQCGRGPWSTWVMRICVETKL